MAPQVADLTRRAPMPGFGNSSGGQDTAYQGFSAIEFDSAGPLLIDFQFGGWSIFTADRESGH
ncbi:MAG: hypothetical protein IPO19_09705 [Rhodoferax sp.]|nr:hypothetical protein [Rhodoferax sp.]